MTKSLANKRAKLKDIISNKKATMEERFMAVLKLAEMPRNSSKTRIRNRCALSGRARGFHRKFNLSRIALRDLASRGELPGVTKSSW
jgi:small subunit ribosomal protein S14